MKEESITSIVFSIAADVCSGDDLRSLLDQFAREHGFPAFMVPSVMERWKICDAKAREQLDDDDYSRMGAFYKELSRYIRQADLDGKNGFSAKECAECATSVGIKNADAVAQVAGNWNHSFDPRSPAFQLEMMRSSGALDKIGSGKGKGGIGELLLLKALLGGKL